MLKKAALIAILVFPISTFATDPVGKWNGRIEIDLSKLPAKERKQAEGVIPKIKFDLTLSKNKTYTSHISISPDGKEHHSTGSWSQKGNAVTLTIKTRDAKPATDKSSQTFTMTADGKTMSMVMEPNGKMGGGKAPSGVPTAKIILKKIG